MKWEYLSLRGNLLDDEELHELGDEGWELIAVVPKKFEPNDAIFYYKRPKDTDKEDGNND